MRLRSTKRFEKSFTALAEPVRKRAQKSIKQFLANPRHPSLHFEKLASGYRTSRVDKNFRIVLLETDGGDFDLIDIATHSKVYSVF